MSILSGDEVLIVISESPTFLESGPPEHNGVNHAIHRPVQMVCEGTKYRSIGLEMANYSSNTPLHGVERLHWLDYDRGLDDFE